MSKWINTKAVFEWDKKSKEYKEISNEGYEYEGDLALLRKWLGTDAQDKTKRDALIKEAFGAGGGIVEEGLSKTLADDPFKITEYAEGGVVGGYSPGDPRTLKDS